MPIEELAKQVVRGLTFERALGCEVRHGHRLLEWRHHGLGMLQAELSESLRIHVWHPTLVSPDMSWPRCVHDHRFDLQSMVVVGAVRDVCPDVRFVKGCDLADLRVATGRPTPRVIGSTRRSTRSSTRRSRIGSSSAGTRRR